MSKALNLKKVDLIRSGVSRNKILLRANLALLIALLTMIFILPVIPLKENYFTHITLCIVVAAGLFAADFAKSAFRILFTLGLLVIITTLLDLFLKGSQQLSSMVFLLNTIFFILITIALVAHITMAREVYNSTLLCAINSYLLIGLTLTILLFIINMNMPGSFNNIETGSNLFTAFIYYGFVTLTTLGFGDITPASTLARSLSAFTALFGQLYLVIIMALIIGKFLMAKKPAD
jgi:voltage-gated potassium channel